MFSVVVFRLLADGVPNVVLDDFANCFLVFGSFLEVGDCRFAASLSNSVVRNAAGPLGLRPVDGKERRHFSRYAYAVVMGKFSLYEVIRLICLCKVNKTS